MGKLEIPTREQFTKIYNAMDTLHSAGAQSIMVKDYEEGPFTIYVAIVEFNHGTEIQAAFDPFEAVARVADDWVEAMKHPVG